MTHPLVSVVLPFYRTGPELEEAIRSILSQTYPHWQLILVNNNAPEFSSTLARKLAATDARVKIVSEQQQGIAYALNTGLQHSEGKYIARLDADDIALPHRLEKQVDFLERNTDTGVVSCKTIFRSVLKKSQGYEMFVNWQNSIITPHEHSLLRFIESPVAHPSVMFRKSLTEKYGPYSLRAIPEDYELWLRWLEKDVLIHKLDEFLVEWNDHSERLSRQHSNYSQEAFFTIKSEYLARWIETHVNKNKKIVVCGSSSNARKKAEKLQNLGVKVFGYTDVKTNHSPEIRFIPYTQLTEAQPWFLINLISQRGVGEKIRNYFVNLGFEEGKDFILAE